MNIVLDLIVIAIIAVFVVLGFKKGVLQTVVSVIATAFASAVSIFVSSPIAEGIYNSILRTTFIEKVEEAVKMGDQTNSGNVLDKILNTLPSFVHDSMFNFGISTKELSSALSNGPEFIVDLISPVIISFISIFVAIFVFIVLMVIVKIIVRVICAAIDSSALGTADKFLGALLGLLEGFVVVFVVIFVVKIAEPHLDKVPEIISEANVSQTTVYKGIYDSEIMSSIVSATTKSPN